MKTGAGLQEFRVLLRKDAAGGKDPTYDLELWETGGGGPLTSDTGEVVAATWDASLLATADGSAVGQRSGGNQSSRRTVEVVPVTRSSYGAPRSSGGESSTGFTVCAVPYAARESVVM